MDQPKSNRIKNWPARERPRERLLREGPERLTDAELLAIILRVGRGTFKSGVSGQSATDLARQLLVDFKSFRGLDRTFIQDLMKVPGLSEAKVAQIKAALEIGKRLHTKRLISPSFESSSAIAKHFRSGSLDARREMVHVVLLNGECSGPRQNEGSAAVCVARHAKSFRTCPVPFCNRWHDEG